MPDPLLLGIDLGAGSLKSTVIDGTGKVHGAASAAVETLAPYPGFSEQDPLGWRAAMIDTLAQLWRQGIDPARIRGIAFTAGAHTHVLEEADGTILRPAIMWNDQRSGPQAAALRESDGARILELSGNQASPTWTLPQLVWVRENEPELFARIRRIRPAKDWLRRQIDGSDATDITDAWGLMLADARSAEGAWSHELCRIAGIDPSVLPPLVGSCEVTGAVTADAAAATGLVAGTPVVCGTSDTNAETFCGGMTRPGLGALKLATAGTVSSLTASPSFSAKVIHYPHLVPGHCYTILGTNSCASAHRWLRDTLFPGLGFEGMDTAARAVAAGSDGLLFHPYLNGERSPYWDPDLRASYVGLGFAHGPGHFVRALYEGIAYSLRDCLEVLRGLDMGFSTARLVGGGTRSELWQQIIADVTGLTIEIPREGDASFGAALVAGMGAGVFADTKAAAAVIGVAATRHPDRRALQRYEEGFALYRETKEALTPVNHRIVAAGRGGN
ncbi:FGGY family carbohydrate kinase [Stappia sp. WLB 29]|uniref:xylulokinase n=1 Tax=Stappia sp. WLB 29 TaxID=2925220 RepID=UPI0020C17DA6|nr:FGGY family carbohydrate kinase [Stappia sp. WLB 29]